jgi:hypothetical protein
MSSMSNISRHAEIKRHAFAVCLGIAAALASASIGANTSAATIKVKIHDVAFDLFLVLRSSVWRP